MEIALQYSCRMGSCTRLQTPFEHFTPQETSKEPHRVKLDAEDFVKLYVVAEGHQKLPTTLTWKVTPVDGQLIRKVIRLEPVVRESTEDVYR